MSITPVLISSGTVYPYDYDTGLGVAVTWLGAYPHLDTADGSGSYAQPDSEETGYAIGVRLSAFTPAGATLTGHWQVKPAFVGVNEFSFRLYDAAGVVLLVQSPQQTVEQPGDEWLSGSTSFDVTTDVVDAAQRGDLIFARSAYNPGPISQLWIEVGRFMPLRQIHRDDGYGMTPPRAFGGASRNRTRRAFGYD